ncbi:hypothetical protein BS055_RS22970 [Vibrio parahaemolyticus]|uniref:hypothetical protein n=1 Tax=Vibrio parahaemolyticus TaxID=670 RepID=UPI00044928B9|nr:hypothetical protein [Vibrio parahaemolyticus]EJG0875506.1 hypothetical protein [Vibrio parahaemolyticus O3]EJG0904136.1 hypothetical protein [Vibrio parahaemolyticus O3:K56]EJG1076965.1 hypothetical protein [Vibrio parahaemolyticus O1:K56]EGR1976121.1 hypothetical protein [Vibrio parahaemolyticus]EGR5853374.1 hypothetical protein [Vibrio parahaemolyticus]
MSLEEKVNLINEGVSLSNVSYIIVFIVTVVSGFIGAFCSSYAKTKGKHLATKEDIDKLYVQTQKLTRATELVKQQVANDSRIESKKWEIKLDIYKEILEALSTWRTIIDQMVRDLFNNDGSFKDTVKTDIVNERVSRMSQVFENIAKIEAMSELVLNVDQVNKVRAIRQEANLGTEVDNIKESFERAIKNIKELEAEIGLQAKEELFGNAANKQFKSDS